MSMPAGEHPVRARGGNGKFTRGIHTIERDRKAAELITMGWTYDQVVAELGYSDKGDCHRAGRRGGRRGRREQLVSPGAEATATALTPRSARHSVPWYGP